MQSPKGSSKHSLVTYGSDISDEESESVSNIPLPTQDRSNDASDLRSMDISPITNDSKSGYSNDPSPKEITQNVTDSNVVIPVKKRRTNDNIGGLVSYPMDENDENDNDSDYIDQDSGDDNYMHNFSKESSNENGDNGSAMIRGNCLVPDGDGVDNDECFNAEDRESDLENDTTGLEPIKSHVSDKNHLQQPTGTSGVDLKSRSGQSSANVKAIVLTKRPKGSELAYLLSRQIYNSRNAEINLPPPPSTKPQQELEMRIAELRSKARHSPWSMTQSILNNKEYRNPSIYEKLIEHMKIDERGTNYPPELYDPYRFGEESYYEVLAKAQDAAERKRLEQGSSGTTSSSKISKSVSAKASEMRMRKTKWDTGSKPAQMTKSYSNTSGLIIETKTMFPVHK